MEESVKEIKSIPSNIEIYSFIFLKESFDKDNAIKLLNEKTIPIKSIIEDDKMIVITIQDIKEDEEKVRLLQLENDIFMITSINDNELLNKIEDIEMKKIEETIYLEEKEEKEKEKKIEFKEYF
jgi:hypothetical protein